MKVGISDETLEKSITFPVHTCEHVKAGEPVAARMISERLSARLDVCWRCFNRQQLPPMEDK